MPAATKTVTSDSHQVLSSLQPGLVLPPAMISAEDYSRLTRPQVYTSPIPAVIPPGDPTTLFQRLPQPLAATVANSPRPEARRLPERVLDAPLLEVGAVSTTPHAPQMRRRNQDVVEALPSSEAPRWLGILTASQRGSTLVTLLLGAGLLAIYGWSVYSQRTWSQAYRQLSDLQREERELVTASETRKHQIALQAENPKTGLVRQVPANIIFLPPETLRQVQPPEPQPAIGLVSSPMGY